MVLLHDATFECLGEGVSSSCERRSLREIALRIAARLAIQ
jgi:hypothetical protein